ncbi:MAG TPA: AAA family ATPase, partial [Terriglobales bacterium]|nr:AAA family ATPase [Terriglobales bacterium]
MRIDSLNLLRYGHFSNREISFPVANPDFHVIYGDNEAGKSTLLRGISALFFGVPARTPDTHSCKGPELRIGGTISDVSGHFSFRRRKGVSGTLLSVEEVQIPESTLGPFLRELDRERFEQFFGLDHERLRAGGEELLRGKGDVGSSLFQAAGLLDLIKLLENLDKEARELFSSKSKGKVIGLALEEYKQARAEVKRLAISASDVKEKEAELQQAKQKHEELRSQSQALHHELVRLRRIAGNKPDIAALQKLREELRGLESVPALPADARRQRDEAALALRETASQIERLHAQIGERKKRIAELPESGLYKIHAAEIEAVNTATRDHVHSLADLVKRQGQWNDAIQKAEEEWRQVWRSRPVTEAETLRGPYDQKSEVLDLIKEHVRLATELEHAEDHVRQGKADRERLSAELALDPEAPDPATLLASVDQAKSLGDVEHIINKLRAEIKKFASEAKRDLRNLPWAPASADEIEKLKTPLLATVDRYVQQWETIEDQKRELSNLHTEVAETIRAKQLELKGLRRTIGEASEAELVESRTRRDRLWDLIRASVFETRMSVENARREAGVREPLPDAFAKQMRRSDEIADSRFGNAGSVAVHDRLAKEIEAAQSEHVRIAKERVDLMKAEDILCKSWTKQWPTLGAAPLPPAEMKEWMQGRAAIMERLRQSREKENEIQALEQRVSAVTAEIRKHLKLLGTKTAADESLAVLIKVSEGVARDLDKRRSAIRDLGRQLQTLDLNKRQARLEDCKTKLLEWSGRWSPRVRELLLPAVSTPDQVAEALMVLEKVFRHLDEANSMQYRVKRIGENIKDFEDRVGRLVAALDPSLSSLAANAAAAHLHARFVEIGRAETERGTLAAQNVTDEATLSSCRVRAEAASRSLEMLKQMAMCSDERELDELIAAAEQKLEKQQEYDRVARGLVDRNAIPDIEQIEREASGFELDALQAAIAEGDERFRPLQDEAVKAGVQLGRVNDELDRLRNSQESILQGQKAEDALAKVRPAVAQYLRLRLASEVLQRAIASYRDKHQGPILHRASQLFFRLTLGDFAGLATAFGEDDQLVLVAVRENKNEVEVAGLSDGTRDQMYLALRLAAIEHHVETVAPCPVIFDDILINSDDSRSAAALEVISELAGRTQVLFFTHH